MKVRSEKSCRGTIGRAPRRSRTTNAQRPAAAAAVALHDPGGDGGPETGRCAAEGGGGREAPQARDKHAPGSEPIAEAAREQEKHGERPGVAFDHPGEPAHPGPGARLDRGNRYV